MLKKCKISPNRFENRQLIKGEPDFSKKQSKNYFTVGIEKKHTNENSSVNKTDNTAVKTTTGANTNSLSFTYNTDKPTGYNDYLYEEILSVKEYELNEKTNEFYLSINDSFFIAR